MRKRLRVTRTNRVSNERITLYEGIGNVDQDESKIKVSYLEEDQHTLVEFLAYDSHAHLRRSGEAQTKLYFDTEQKQTTGSIINEYGCIELMVHTHTYIRTPSVIAVEYDILNSDEVVESYRLLWKIKELSA